MLELAFIGLMLTLSASADEPCTDAERAALLQEAETLAEAGALAEASGATDALGRCLLSRMDTPMSDAEARALGPPERRLLRDGVRAFRGRATPSAAHARIFDAYTWYLPVSTYTDRLLEPADHHKIAQIDHPPDPPVEEAARGGALEAIEEITPAPTPQGCGCAAQGEPVGWLAVPGLAGLLGLTRRREDPR